VITYERRQEWIQSRRYAGSIRLTYVAFTEAEPHSRRVALVRSGWDGHCVELSRSQDSRPISIPGQSPMTRDTVHATRSERRSVERSGANHLDGGSKRWSTRLSMAGDRVRATCLCFINESGGTGGTWRCRSSAAWRGVRCPVDRPCSRFQLGRGVAGRARTAGASPAPLDRPLLEVPAGTPRAGEWDARGPAVARSRLHTGHAFRAQPHHCPH